MARRVGAAVLWTCVLCAGCGFTPSDSALERTFKGHRTEFEKLRQLIMEDSSRGILLSVRQDRTDPDEAEAFRRGLSRERLDTYRRLLIELNLRGVGRAGDDVILQASAVGFLMHGSVKGYLYSKETPRTVPERLAYQQNIKHLEGPWYLYYRRD